MPKKVTKKTVAKPVSRSSAKTVSKVKSQFSIFSWAFSAEKPINWKKYAGAILMFIIATIVVISLLSALSMKMQLAAYPEVMAVHSEMINFWSRVSMFPTFLIGIAHVQPISFILITLLFVLVGAFAFMPRATLGRKSFVAAHLTALFWTSVSTGVLLALKRGPIELSALLVSILLVSSILLYVSTVSFARGLNISKWKMILSFPFGYTFFNLTGFFLPTKSADNVSIKYSWYNKLIDFLIGTKPGLISMAILEIAALILFPYPWAIFLASTFAAIALIAGFNKTAKNISALSWIPVIVNIALIVSGFVLFEFFTSVPLSILAM